jgi:GT2 family glycosyltransferase
MYDIIGSIVLYQNSAEEVQEAIRSFLNTRLNVKLHVIDNSPEPLVSKLFEDSRVSYVFNGRNLGFGAAHNLAMRSSLTEAAYHVALNPDVYFDPGVLEKLFDFARSRPDVGLVMPRVLNPGGSVQYLCKKLPTPFDLILRRFLPGPFRRLVEERLAQYELRDQDYSKMMSVPALSGCFMMMNCAALAQVGLFDERYFLYLEDVDLCRRIHQNFKTIYYPEVAIYHGYQKGSYRSVRLMLRHMISALQYFHKWGWYNDSERNYINQKPTADFLTK